MPVPTPARGVKILKAVSSPLRLQILSLLFDKGSLSYTELMVSLKMNPTRDAGRFAYHLKSLLKADLIEAVVETKKYCLTDLGKMVIDVADRVEKRASRPKSMLVRASRLAMEEFDANKIAAALMREAKVPAELAQRVAKEAEKQLLKSKTKYLTAPLVREVVNAILIEKGLEDYRHKLTRLGIPVHDVPSLIESTGAAPQGSAAVHEAAGRRVLEEYTLLNVLPRDIADAHLSGQLHISGLSSWILRPTEVTHDMRYFMRKGLSPDRIDASQPSVQPPQNLESALSLTLDVLLHSKREVEATQALEYFNIFLAPYTRNMEPQRVKEALHLFAASLAQHTNTSLSLELTVPDFMAAKPAFGPSGKAVGTHGDFVEETQLLASLLLEVLAERSERKPLHSPRLVVKTRRETFTDDRARALLLKAHSLASQSGIPYFANLLQKDREQSAFSSSGCRLSPDSDGDWEIDTVRTGLLGVVTVNVPRAACESGKDKTRFHEVLKERLEMASRALEIKHRALRQHGNSLLPFILQREDGDQYIRLESCSRVINMAGLREGLETLSGRSIDDEKTLELAEETAQTVAAYVQKMGRRHGKRLYPAVVPSVEASERLAQLDIERYGVAKVRFSGSREKPYYSTIGRLTLGDGGISEDAPVLERKLKGLRVGGGLTVIELGVAESRPDELFAVTKQLVEGDGAEFFTYDRKMTHCGNCKRSWPGLLHKCSSCGATGTLTFFDRFAGV